ncbi:MAG: tetratricopeptide repeat protein [Pirellulales bacterium]
MNAKLRKVLRGDKGEGLELIFTVLLDDKHFADARVALDELTKSFDNPAALSYHRAALAARSGDRATAVKELNAYFDARETSRGYAPYELLRDVLKSDDRAAELIPLLEKRRADQPDDASLNYALAEEYRRAGEHAKAIPAYEATLEKQSSREAYRGLVESLIAMKQNDNLIQLLGTIVEKSGSLEALEKAMSSDDATGDKSDDKKDASLIDDALRRTLVTTILKRYDGKDAAHAPVLRAAGALAVEAERWNDARTAYDRAIAAKPTDKAEILLRLGVQLLIGEQTAAAVEVFQRGVDERVMPDSNPVFYYYLAGALAYADRHDDALKAARQAAEKQPKNPRFAVRVPWIENHAKHYDAARDGYLALLKKHEADFDRDDVREVMRESRLLLSNIAVLQKDFPTAEEHLECVLDEFPDDVGAMNDLGYLWIDQNKHLDRGLRMIEIAIRSEPENQAYLDSLGWALYRHGRYPEALAAQLKAAAPRKNRETDGVVLDHLADIYAALDRRDEELATRRRAIQALEKSDEQGKIEDVRKKLKLKENG